MGKSCAECLYWTQVTCLSVDPGVLFVTHSHWRPHWHPRLSWDDGVVPKEIVYSCVNPSLPLVPGAPFAWTPILWLTCDPRMHRAQSNSTGSFDRFTRPHAVYTCTLHKLCVSPFMLTQYVKCTAALLKLCTSEDFFFFFSLFVCVFRYYSP